MSKYYKKRILKLIKELKIIKELRDKIYLYNRKISTCKSLSKNCKSKYLAQLLEVEVTKETLISLFNNKEETLIKCMEAWELAAMKKKI